MDCRIRDMRNKEVINICDGCRLGFVADMEIRLPDGDVGMYEFGDLADAQLAKALEIMQQKLQK